METSIHDQPKVVSDLIDQPSVTPDSQTTDNSSSKFSDSLSTQVDLTFTSKGLHIANLNVRHFLPKMDELTLTIGTENGPDIIGICETFLDPSVGDSQLSINHFDLHRKDRCETQDKSGGGLLLYFRKSLNCKRRPELEISKIETLWTEVTLTNTKPFLICTLYRPPSATSEWIDLLEEELSVAQTTGLEMIIMGDLNIDFQACSNNKWLNLVQLFDLTQLVTKPTRITQYSSTLIDHVYTTNPENISECYVPSYSISDHFPVCFSRKTNCKISKNEHITTTYRSFKNFNETHFLQDLATDLGSFSDILVDSDINEACFTWIKTIQHQLDHHAPVKARRVKHKRLPEWSNQEILTTRKLRDISKRHGNWPDYKKYRNKTKTLIRQAKKHHFSEAVTNLKDTKSIWKHLRTANKKTSACDNALPDELEINGQQYTNSQDIAFKLNDYFASISEYINTNDVITSAPDLTKLETYISSKIPLDTFFRIPKITVNQVSEFINGLNPAKATGLDGIGPRILKLASTVLSPSITALINKSIETATFPDQLKMAKLYPIHKGGSKSDPANYRPISILPTISKIFEKHINKHLVAFLNKYKVIHANQSGFRQKHSCQTALVKLIDQWMACIDRGDIVGSVFLDFRKAFDLVDHSILIDKLSLYKCQGPDLNLISSYLQSRQQVIDSGKGLSTPAYIKSGVPQGSILGPTLFLIFINDLPLHMEYCDIDLFADDATFHANGKTKSEVEPKLQTDGNNSKSWAKHHKMQIHYDKTSCMTLGSRHRTQNEASKLDITIDGNEIKQVDKQKLLGVYIDENLLWTTHIDYLCSTISTKISLLKQLSTYVPVKVQKLFYQGYILPLIDYGSNTWGSTSKLNIERLSKLQKRAARIILKADFDTPSSEMFNELGWSTIENRHNYNKAVLTYKALNDLTPEYISNLLKPTFETHNRKLRSATNGSLSVPRSRTSLFDRSFSATAPKLWNSLPKEITTASSLENFKQLAKTNFMNR